MGYLLKKIALSRLVIIAECRLKLDVLLLLAPTQGVELLKKPRSFLRLVELIYIFSTSKVQTYHPTHLRSY